jgi:hypothetical protein
MGTLGFGCAQPALLFNSRNLFSKSTAADAAGTFVEEYDQLDRSRIGKLSRKVA